MRLRWDCSRMPINACVWAQFALVKKGDFKSLEASRRDTKASQLARIHAIWGLGQGLRAKKIEAAPLTKLLSDSDPEILTQVAKMLGDAVTDGKPLVSLLTSNVSRVRFHAAIALGKLAEPSAEKNLLAMAEKESGDPFMRHAIVTGLAGCVERIEPRGACEGQIEPLLPPRTRTSAFAARRRFSRNVSR
jgi:quinoprotein glucose dehydrogenase